MLDSTYLRGDCEEPLEQAQDQGSQNTDQESRHNERAIAQMSGMKVLEAISSSVPGKLMTHDLLFLSELLISGLDLRQLKVLIRLHGIKRTRDAATSPKMLANSIQKMEDPELMRLLVECAILIAARPETMTSMVLRNAAQFYGVDVQSICAKVRRQVTKNSEMAGTAADSPNRSAAA